MRIVFSGVDYGSYHSELKIPVLRIEIMGPAVVERLGPKSRLSNAFEFGCSWQLIL
jgi:hypothetical protein